MTTTLNTTPHNLEAIEARSTPTPTRMLAAMALTLAAWFVLAVLALATMSPDLEVAPDALTAPETVTA